jgi:hypothetical protein
MKAIIFLFIAAVFSLNTIAADPHGDKYCAKMRDGKMVIMYEGKTVTADVTLANGTLIKTDGTIIRQDGTSVMLKEGECIDRDGKIMMKPKKDKPY